MFPLFILLTVAVICGVAWLLARAARLSFPRTTVGCGVVGMLVSIAWGVIKLQHTSDGPGCSTCIVSARGSVILVAAAGAGVGLLVCVAGILIGLVMAPPRRAAPPVKSDSTSVE